MTIERMFSAQEEVFEFLTTQPTPEQIIAFRPSQASQERMSFLLEKNRNGQISSDELEELDEYLRLGRFMDRLKIKAREKLS